MCNLYLASNSPFTEFADGDPRYYLDWASRILDGQWTDGKAFFGLPFYPYWLASLFAITGKNFVIPLVIQALADGIVAFIIAELAIFIIDTLLRFDRTIENPSPSLTRSFAWWISLAAGLTWALYQPAQAYAVTLMPTTLAVCAFWVLVSWIVRLERTPSAAQSAGVGIGMGAAATLVANILVLLPLALAKFIASGPRGRGVAIRCSALAFGVVLGCSPCWLHNYLVAHEPVVFSAHGGINFYLGNQPGATGYPKMPQGFDASQAGLREAAQLVPEQAAGHALTRTEASAYWNALTMQSIRADPWHWLGLIARKVRNYWNKFQYDDIAVITALQDSHLITFGPRFGVIAMLGLPGLVACCAVSRPSRWVAGAIALQMISLLPVFVTERYRMPAVPGLIIGAAGGIYLSWQWISGRNWGDFVKFYAAPLAAAVWIVNLPTRDPSLWAVDYYNSSRLLLANGELDAAGRRAEQAFAIAPNNPEIRFLLGNYWLAKGDREKAKTFYLETLQINPNHVRTWNNVGVMALEEQRWTMAAQFLQRAIVLSPRDAKAHFLLARALQGSGNIADAVTMSDIACQLDPSRPEFQALSSELRAKLPSTAVTPDAR